MLYKGIDNLLNQIGVHLQLSLNKFNELKKNYDALSKYINNQHILSSDDGSIYVQGSFSTDTMIKPIHKEEVDVDVVCVFDDEWKPGIHVQPFYDKLVDVFSEGRYKEITEEYKNVVRINYVNNYHFDIMPTLPLSNDNKGNIKAVDTNKSKWIDRAPYPYSQWFLQRSSLLTGKSVDKNYTVIDKGLYNVIKDMAVDTLEKPSDYYTKPPLNRVVQLIKRARDIFFRDDEEFVPQSIVITTLVAEKYDGEMNLGKSLLDAATYFYNLAKSKMNFRVSNPVYDKEEFTDKWHISQEFYINFRKFSYWLVYHVRNLFSDNPRVIEKSVIQLFGSNVYDKVSTSKFTSYLNSGLVLHNDRRLEQEEVIQDKYKMDLTSYVEIDCTYTNKRYNYSKNLRLSDKKMMVLPNSSLKFYVSDTDVQGQYEVLWKVRNVGHKALERNMVRGSIESGFGDEKRESADFVGYHFVECYIVQGGKVVAADRIDVPIGVRLS